MLEKYPPQYYEMELNRKTQVKILLNTDIIHSNTDIPVKVLFEDPAGETISVSIQIEIAEVIFGSLILKSGINTLAKHKTNQFLFQGTVTCVEQTKKKNDRGLLRVIRSFRMPNDQKPEQFRIESYEIPIKIKP